ncbi:hypothetical protein AcV5_010105 [Taiwanofungus camphoratus]|nr:hypothetical protein AcV5_010105 [Antrodia cinnamomea]
MSDPTYPLFPVFAFLGFVLALVPLSWHLEAWNSATCYYMIWASLACFNKFVNSVVWANSALNPAPIWCDISTRIIIGASVGIPAASLCINRRLYLIARVHAVSVTRAEKRRAILVDSLVCVLFPIVCMVLAYIVQGHRFNVYEEIGCYPAIYNTLPAYFLVNWWPVVLGVISAVYCSLSLRAFALRRAQFHEFLSSNKTTLTFGRYFRLMALATTELAFTIPIASYGIYLNATVQPVEPWVSWSNTHFAFSRVEQIPSVIWRMNHQLVVALELGQWLNPICALIFFAYFGFAGEARKNYKAAFCFVARRLGFTAVASTKPDVRRLGFAPFRRTTPSDVLPVYSPSTPSHLKDARSLDSAVNEKAAYLEHLEDPYTSSSPSSVSISSDPISGALLLADRNDASHR